MCFTHTLESAWFQPLSRYEVKTWFPKSLVSNSTCTIRAGDAALVRRFASPSNVAATGPLALFEKMLASALYAPLSEANAAVKVLKTAQLSRDAFVELVEVTSAAQKEGGKFYYLWLLGRQPAARQAGHGLASAAGGSSTGSDVVVPVVVRGHTAAAATAAGAAGAGAGAAGEEDTSGCWMTDAVTAVQPADLVAFGL
jgi:hypothetical protein